MSYAVAGAFAVFQHSGICRDTKDLDIFLTPENASLALPYLREEGFECEVCDPVWLFKAHRDSFFVDLITGMSNAAIVVEDSWIAHARPALVQEVQTRVLAAEELIASKLFIARRERFDGADIAHVIFGTHGKVDWQRILTLVGEHWEILLWALVLFRYVYPAQTDYVSTRLWCDLVSPGCGSLVRTGCHFPRKSGRRQAVRHRRHEGPENVVQEYRERRLKVSAIAAKVR
jgi:hypothetical protein